MADALDPVPESIYDVWDAQIDARDEKGETPLDWCEKLNGRGADEIRELFSEYGHTVDR